MIISYEGVRGLHSAAYLHVEITVDWSYYISQFSILLTGTTSMFPHFMRGVTEN